MSKPHFVFGRGRWWCLGGPTLLSAVGVGHTVREAWKSLVDRAIFAAEMSVNWMTGKPI